MSWKAEAVAAQESFLLELVKEMIMRIHYKKEKFQAVVTKHLSHHGSRNTNGLGLQMVPHV